MPERASCQECDGEEVARYDVIMGRDKLVHGDERILRGRRKDSRVSFQRPVLHLHVHVLPKKPVTRICLQLYAASNELQCVNHVKQPVDLQT